MQIKNLIDIHCHILPGLDDGARDMAESLEIARRYQQTGIRRVVATPHFLPGTAWAAEKEVVLQAVQELQDTLNDNGIDLQVFAGMEIAFHKKLQERLVNNCLLPLGKSGYYLIEPSFYGEQDTLLQSLREMLQDGHKCILAHPERVERLSNRLDAIAGLVEQGLIIQVNGGSLLDYFGPESREMAHLLYRNNCLHVIASDAHNTSKRPPLTTKEWAILYALEEGDILNNCHNNMNRIFATTIQEDTEL